MREVAGVGSALVGLLVEACLLSLGISCPGEAGCPQPARVPDVKVNYRR